MQSAGLAVGKSAECEANYPGRCDIMVVLNFNNLKRLALIVSIPLLFAAAADAAPVIFIVRHGEKASTGGNDPDLSPEGQKRGDALARILKDSQITSVFVTEFKRTQETAAPTTKATHVSPIVISANDNGALVEKLRSLNGNALVVGHGNTIPDLLKALGIATPVSIPDDVYAEIFAVLIGDPPQLLRLQYPF